MNYTTLSKKPSRFLRYTGLSIAEFDKLTKKIEPLWEKRERIRLSRPNRKRAIGAGGKYHLSLIEDKLLLLMIFYKLYLTDELLGELFNLNASNVCRLIQKMEPILSKKINLPEIKKEGTKKISTLDELLILYPDILEFIADATEQGIPRPKKDKKKRKIYYSGKKKKHTIKTQLFIERNNGKILDVSQSVPGSIHDYNLFKRSRIGERLPRDIPFYLDKGYQGAKKDYPHLNLFIPQKSNRWHKISQKDKLFNKFLASIRVKVEHTICRCKKFKILSEIYRHHFKNYNLRFKIVAGLVNLRIQELQNNQINQSLLSIKQPITIPIMT